jgi:hypothetical protein
LRQVSLDKTAKTRQLLKMAENGWKCWKWLKMLVYQDYHANLPSSIFSICQQFLPVSAIFSFRLIIGKRVRVKWGWDKVGLG